MNVVTDKSRERKTSEGIKEAILLELNKGPKSASEIADIIKSNWVTTEKFLNELLEEKKVIEIISAQKSKVYASLSDPAFFYLPLSEKTRENTLSLLKTITEIWKKENGTIPQKTILQKLAVQFVEENNLQKEIPVLRFHYGQTLALRFEENIEVKPYKLPTHQETILISLVKEYKNYSATDAKSNQYEKPSMRFYKTKEETQKDFKKNNLLNMLVNYPKELSLSFELFDKLVYCGINILHLKNNEEYLPDLKEVFSLVWDCLTTEAYFYDIEAVIPEDKMDLFNQIKSNYLNSKIRNVSNVIEQLENEINSLPPMEINTSDNLSDFMHELFNE